MPRKWPHAEDGSDHLTVGEKLIGALVVFMTLVGLAGCARNLLS